MKTQNNFFSFEMNTNGGFSYNCKGWIITFIYPIIMLAGTLMSIISYPIFLIVLIIKLFGFDLNSIIKKKVKKK